MVHIRKNIANIWVSLRFKYIHTKLFTSKITKIKNLKNYEDRP